MDDVSKEKFFLEMKTSVACLQSVSHNVPKCPNVHFLIFNIKGYYDASSMSFMYNDLLYESFFKKITHCIPEVRR